MLPTHPQWKLYSYLESWICQFTTPHEGCLLKEAQPVCTLKNMSDQKNIFFHIFFLSLKKKISEFSSRKTTRTKTLDMRSKVLPNERYFCYRPRDTGSNFLHGKEMAWRERAQLEPFGEACGMSAWVRCPSVYTARRLYILLLGGNQPPEREDAARPQEMLSKDTDAATLNRVSHDPPGTSPQSEVSSRVSALALFIPHHHSGPYAEANYSIADRRPVYSLVSCCDQIWKQDSLPKPQGHISKVRPSSC